MIDAELTVYQPRLLSLLTLLAAKGALSDNVTEYLDPTKLAGSEVGTDERLQAALDRLIEHRIVMTPLFQDDWFEEQCRLAGLTVKDASIRRHVGDPVFHHISPHRLIDAAWFVKHYEVPADTSILEYLAALPTTAKINPFFDGDFYSLKQSIRKGYAFVDFDDRGWREGLNPSPYFSTRDYLDFYPDIRDWGVNPLFHFLHWGAREFRQPRSNAVVVQLNGASADHKAMRHQRRLELDGPFKGLAIDLWDLSDDETTRAVRSGWGIDPLLDKALVKFPQLPVRSLPNAGPRFQFGRLLLRDPLASSSLWILTSWLVKGGAERVIANFANAYTKLNGQWSCTVIVTDSDRLDVEGWFESGVNIVMLKDLFRDIDSDEAVSMLRQAIVFCKPAHVLNINSLSGWKLFERYGRPLSTITKLSASFFCHDYDEKSIPVGYCADYLDSSLSYISHYVTDHGAFLNDQFACRYLGQAEKDKIEVLYQPVSFPGPSKRKPRAKQKRVLWLGRYSRQKRPDLAADVAKLLSSFEVHFIGPGFPPDISFPDNCRVLQPVESFDRIDVSAYTCLLYTALWDGLPNVLLEAGSAELPIVAPSVGGIPELIGPKTGWLVSSTDTAEAYAGMVKAIQDSPVEARRRAQALRTLIADRHSPEAFAKRLELMMRVRT